jgi:hypothetical protein
VRSKPVTFETARELALALPGVVASMGARGMAFRVRGKMFACKAIHRSAEEGSLVVRFDPALRAKLIASDPNVYYLTPHYEPHPTVLVRLSRIRREALDQLLQEASRFVTSEAPKKTARKPR